MGRAAPHLTTGLVLVILKVAPSEVDHDFPVFVVLNDPITVSLCYFRIPAEWLWHHRLLLLVLFANSSSVYRTYYAASRRRTHDQTVLGDVLVHILDRWVRVDEVLRLLDRTVRQQERTSRTVLEHRAPVRTATILRLVLEVIPVALVDQKLALLATLDKLEIGRTLIGITVTGYR
uniref:Putative secreted protein n=1 Tax=Anopheles marajoara TaxID=58244 RepID=A0A2M4C5Z1_9DIPT